jgi:hypothetical protein
MFSSCKLNPGTYGILHCLKFKYKQTLQSEAFASDYTLFIIVHRSKSFWGKQLLQGILRFVVFGRVYASFEANTSVLAKLGSG